MKLHRPVMLDEAVAGLAVRDDGIYVDGTFGRGGHSAAVLARLGPAGRLHAFDQDPQAVAHGREHFADEPRLTIHHRNFAELARTADEAGIAGRIDGILLDLGVSSPQLDDAERGFSFGKAGPLDMRMNPQAGESAAEWLAQAGEAEIADVLWQYGDERNSRRIARRIVDTRAATPLTTTAQLADLIAAVPGPRSRHIHPATRSFQAIRIFINRELDVLRDVLQQAIAVLAPGGRLVVISFHSLEDRIVKRYLRDEARSEVPTLKLHGKQFPTREESSENPRARSAVLRIAERLP
ncbi:16S rRNA (cytosine(1402)-N(4))-methyltransferase RsmH [Solimonas marina]|uniref:Ribosomal RNA small subunit methyltransferase H n=1 Tax=Solimonas marina TaxID=2714601 RepID=A0A969WCJ1_9GAMM|nr:16S rRNA (cytosine(1402)-N(4))-methyltransferase RsmH [Solimonas marina]NKF22921.1 16S rRNA (cytosine(1402)-N(4))-methyltransferase RsmH [Solimonas marina]